MIPVKSACIAEGFTHAEIVSVLVFRGNEVILPISVVPGRLRLFPAMVSMPHSLDVTLIKFVSVCVLLPYWSVTERVTL